MSILGLGKDPAPVPVRIAVFSAILLVAGTFGMSIASASQPIVTAEAIESSAQ